jgi:arginyl-tRNA synthetase
MKAHLQGLLSQALAAVCEAAGKPMPVVNIAIDATKDKAHGDFATNLAMVACKGLGLPPRDLAARLLAALPASDQVLKAELAGPGFINFFLQSDALASVVPQILAAGPSYGQDLSGSKGKLMVEFVSANPTGPMHVGHGRGAAYGDSLANLLAATGWQVQREYYINDAGRQVDILALSVWLRYLEAGGEPIHFPKRGYPAEYIRVSAEKLRQQHGAAWQQTAAAVFAGLGAEPQIPADADDKTKDRIKLEQEKFADGLIGRARSLLGADGYQEIVQAALADQLATIRQTLESFSVRFDHWASEAALVQSGFAHTAVQRLRDKGYTYVQDGAEWLKTSAFGDEKDRVLFKADGAATYFANDLAYHVSKLDRLRGACAANPDALPLLVDVWGADHHGYIARVRAAIEMLTDRKDALHVALMQFVTLSSGRMGKRSGNFVTLQDLLDEAGPDATRFFYLYRSHDQHLEFDVDLAKSRSNDNPVYYIQYAHARICSVFRQLAEKGGSYDEALGLSQLGRLDSDAEKALLQQLARYPELLAAAAQNRTPHSLAFYLKDLAEALHSNYNQHKVLLPDDLGLQNARLALLQATQTVLQAALKLLGVSAPERM